MVDEARDIKDNEDIEDEESEDGEEKKSRLPSRKIMIMAAGVILLLAGGSGGAWYFGLFGGSGKPEKVTVKKVAKSGYYDLPEMVVNLASEKGKAHFLKVRITIQLPTKLDVSFMKPYEPAILDIFQVYLRELRRDDLEGSAGLFRLKSELLKRVNSKVHPIQASAVLFREIIVQ
jgi:flagellar FliL protein